MKRMHLKPTLVLTVFMALLSISLAIEIPAYIRAKSSITDIWENLSRQIVGISIQRSWRYLNPAVLAVHSWNQMTNDGLIDLSKTMDVLDITYIGEKVNTDFDWSIFVKPEGTFLASYCPGWDCTRIQATWREQQADGKTHFRNFIKSNDGTWKQTEDYNGTFDPRQFPFWTEGSISVNGTWTQPFMNPTTMKPSIAFTQAQYLQGKFAGVWSVQFELSSLSHYLQTLKEKIAADIYIIGDDDTLIASSQEPPTIIESIGKVKGIDPNVILAWEQIKSEGGGEKEIALSKHYIYTNHFPKELGVPWSIMTIIPAKALLGAIDRERTVSLSLSIIFSVLCTLATALFFGKIASRLKGHTKDIQDIGKLQFTKADEIKKRTHVHEVDNLSQELDNTKTRLTTILKYLPLELVRKITAQGDIPKPGAVKSSMSLLSCQIVKFATIENSLSPDAIVQMLGEYYDTMNTAILSNQGDIIKYIGDRILAIWGAPAHLQSHPLYACQGALAMRTALAQLNEVWQQGGKPAITHRMGINTQEMLIGNIGSARHMDFSPVGEGVNLAMRLNEMNRVFNTSILISEETAKAVRNELIVRPIDWIYIKGKTQVALIYELMGTRATITPVAIKAIEIYQKALDAYKAASFQDAANLFEQVKQQLGGDRPSELMAQKCLNFQKNPPPPDWNGVTLLRDE